MVYSRLATPLNRGVRRTAAAPCLAPGRMRYLRKVIETRRTRAADFASLVGGCKIHRREARAVFMSLEELLKRPLRALSPETSIVELLPWVQGGERDILVLGAARRSDLVAYALREYLREKARASLLGPFVQKCTWTPDTIGARSVRGIVNERVRLRGGCTCAAR